ncbi:MAG: MCE family protein [Streptosporangiales bacterium]|nr:MCE family protein [Streptosporangiales bacterium]
MSHALRWRSPTTVLAVGALAVAVAVSAGVIAVLWPSFQTKRLTAYFERAVGLYPESDVRVLGVPVGKVTEITPAGGQVRVEMSYQAERTLPADVKAVVLAPSLASDRYVQLTPVYHGGPALEDGATIPTSRTAVPVEIDEIFASLNELNVALGPRGANREGSLSRLLTVGADNLDGQGENINETTENLAEAARTLSGGREDLFDTVRNLQTFTAALAESDQQVRAFNEDLAEVSTQLDAERDELAAALKNLSLALAEVTEFVRANRGELTANVDDLTTVSKVLVRQQDALTEVLDTMPVYASNGSNAYNPTSQTLDTRPVLQQGQDPAMFICSLLYSLDVPPTECEPLLAPLNLFAQDTLPLGLDLSPLTTATTTNANVKPPPSDAYGNGQSSDPDPTLGGILPRQQ